MPPKKTKLQSKPQPSAAPAKKFAAPKGDGKLKLPTYAFFTHKSVGFNKLARDLSDRLKDLYGPEVTISQFEKLVAEFPSYSAKERELIYLDKELLDLLASYRSAKDSKDTERRSFRSDISIKDVATGLEACLSITANGPAFAENLVEAGQRE